MSSTDHLPRDQALSPLNFIYACGICCATFAEVYDGTHETVQGLSDGINEKERLVTKLFLGSCCHVFCSTHLENGAPPFHPDGRRPSAPCPVCMKDKDDKKVKELFSVRGFHDDEHDPAIPSAWFTAPPISLDGSGNGMEALRFQYLALIRYCQSAYSSHSPVAKGLAESKKKALAMEKLASEEHAILLRLRSENEDLRRKNHEMETLRSDVARLATLEKEIKTYRQLNVNPRDLEFFRANRAAIKHYLKLVPMLIEQNDKMQSRLASLGFAMALEPIPRLPDADVSALEGRLNESHDVARQASSRDTIGRSEHTAETDADETTNSFGFRPFKRQRVDSPQATQTHQDAPRSREVMPPPAKPMSRMRSMRQMIPTLRKKFSSKSGSLRNARAQPHDTEMVEDGFDGPMSDQHPIATTSQHAHSSFMSGALPIERSPAPSSPQKMQNFPIFGTKGNASNFTFQVPSPTAMNSQNTRNSDVQIVSEPSYIRLMDGLTQGEDLELALQDPRQRESAIQPRLEGNEQVCNNTYLDTETESPYTRKQQIRSVSYLGTMRKGDAQRDQSHQAQLFQTKAASNSGHHGPLVDPRFTSNLNARKPQILVDNIVSPQNVRGYDGSRAVPVADPAEATYSSSLSDVYQSRISQVPKNRTDWSKPRGLNGLSFFESPMNARHEAIADDIRWAAVSNGAAPDRYHGHYLDSQGFIARPRQDQSPYFGDSMYGSSTEVPTSVSQRARLSDRPIMHFLPSKRSPGYRRIQTSRIPATPMQQQRTRAPQWERLQRTGVRSSRRIIDTGINGHFTGRSWRTYSDSVRLRAKRS